MSDPPGSRKGLRRGVPLYLPCADVYPTSTSRACLKRASWRRKGRKHLSRTSMVGWFRWAGKSALAGAGDASSPFPIHLQYSQPEARRQISFQDYSLACSGKPRVALPQSITPVCALEFARNNTRQEPMVNLGLLSCISNMSTNAHQGVQIAGNKPTTEIVECPLLQCGDTPLLGVPPASMEMGPAP